MIAERYPGLALLSDEDKLTLMAELWDDVTDKTATDDPALAEFVEKRWREFQEHPERASNWSEVKARILASRP